MPEIRSDSDRYTTKQDSDAWAADAARRGKAGTQVLLEVTSGHMTPDIQRALGLDDAQPVVVRRRLILADDQPVELADSYYPASLAGGTPLAQKKKIRGGAVAVLEEIGHAIDGYTQTVTARHPQGTETEQLEVPPDEPLIVLSRVNRDAAGIPVEYAVNVMVAARTAPLVFETRGSSQ